MRKKQSKPPLSNITDSGMLIEVLPNYEGALSGVMRYTDTKSITREGLQPSNSFQFDFTKNKSDWEQFLQSDFIPRYLSDQSASERLTNKRQNRVATPYTVNLFAGFTDVLNNKEIVGYYDRKNNIYISPAVIQESGEDPTEVLVEEGNHFYYSPKKQLLYTKDNADKINKVYKQKSNNYGNSNTIEEKGATNTKIRYKLWRQLKEQLGRTPTVKELDDYIDNYDKLPLLFEQQDSYSDDYVIPLDKDQIDALKDALKSVADNASNHSARDTYYAEKGTRIKGEQSNKSSADNSDIRSINMDGRRLSENVVDIRDLKPGNPVWQALTSLPAFFYTTVGGDRTNIPEYLKNKHMKQVDEKYRRTINTPAGKNDKHPGYF